jgi:hypothetical protein
MMGILDMAVDWSLNLSLSTSSNRMVAYGLITVVYVAGEVKRG